MIKKTVTILIIFFLLGISNITFAKEAVEEYSKTTILMGDKTSPNVERVVPLNKSKINPNAIIDIVIGPLLPLYENSNFFVCETLEKNLGILEAACIKYDIKLTKCGHSSIIKDNIFCVMYVSNPKEKFDFIKTIVLRFGAQPFKEVNMHISFSGNFGGTLFQEYKHFYNSASIKFNNVETAYIALSEIIKIPFGNQTTIPDGMSKYFPDFIKSFPTKKFNLSRLNLSISVNGQVDNHQFTLFQNSMEFSYFNL